jgi:hypothetical protein
MAKIRISNAGGAVIDIGNLDPAGPEAQAIVDQAVNQYQADPLSQATPPPAPPPLQSTTNSDVALSIGGQSPAGARIGVRMPDGSTQALTLPPGMDSNDPRVGSIVDEYLSASPGAPQPQPQPQATLSGPSVWDVDKQLANRVTDTITGTTRNAQGEIISTQPTMDTTGRQFSEELDIAQGMSPEQTAANMRKRINDGLDTARFVGETLVPQNLADAASMAALIATATIAGIAGVAIRAAAAPIADMVTRAAAGQPRDLTTALIKGVGSLVGDVMGRSVQYLGFIAQPPEEGYFRDDAIATGSGMARTGKA